MKKMIILLSMMLVVASAWAVVDPDPNMMGFYFDESADTPCVLGAAPYSTHVMHLILTNPTFDELFGFEAGYDVDGPAQVLGTQFAVDDALNVGGPDNMIVGFGTPMPTTEATLLVSISVLYMSTTDEEVDFFLHGSDPGSIPGNLPVVLLADGVLIQVGLSAATGPTSLINGDYPCGVVATQPMSFDNLKSLYR